MSKLKKPTDMKVIYELCPKCENEVKLVNKFEVQKCPECNVDILPCSICGDYYNCRRCPFERGE